tara:strand:+ start:249 stop:986 length:738 start_codon:yes stop_codon:yes gene_type:complete
MNIRIYDSKKNMGEAAGNVAAELIRQAIAQKGEAVIVTATGASQFETVDQLVAAEGIDWSKVTMFHLDEYIGLPVTHPASFRKYLQERYIDRIPAFKAYYLINGENDPELETQRLNELISEHTIDLAMVGIGENGHLAFNDPPADFDTKDPYIVVNLDNACRMQQHGEGWFNSLEEVPTQAISMSVSQILKSEHLLCTVPDLRKAAAVKACLEGEISNLNPASILRTHPNTQFIFDQEAASLLTI